MIATIIGPFTHGVRIEGFYFCLTKQKMIAYQGSGHRVLYDLRRLCQPLLHCAGLTDLAAGNLTALRAVSNL